MIYYIEQAWESCIHFYCRQKRAFITDRIKPRFLSAETQNRAPFLPFPYSLHRFGFYLWTEIAEDGTVRAGHGRGKRAGQLFVHNRREKIQLDLASSGLVFFFFPPAAQCLTVFRSEDMVLRTTESCTVSLQRTVKETVRKKQMDYNEPLYIYLRTHFYIIVLCH